MKNIVSHSAGFAAVAVMAAGFVASALPTPAPDDNLQADYQISSVTPANCTQVDELSTITILYDVPEKGWSPEIQEPYAPDLWNPEQPYKKLEVKSKGKTVSTLSVEGCFVSYGPTTLNLIFSLDKPQTADGIYEIVIPEKFIVDGAKCSTGKMTLRYQIGDGIGDETPDEPDEPATGFRLDSMSPASEEQIPELSLISSKWLDSNDQPCVWIGPSTLLVRAKDAEGNYFTVGRANVDAGNGSIFFTLNHSYDAFGTVYMTIPAGAISSQDGSEKNEEPVDLTYYIIYDKGINKNSTYPAEYSDVDATNGMSMETVAVMYAQNMSVGTGDRPYLVQEDGEIIECSDIFVADVDHTQGSIVFQGADMLPEGQYTVVVPRNAFSGATGFSYYYKFRPQPGQEIPDIPDDVKLEFTRCTIDNYDMLDPDNGIFALGIDAYLTMSTNLDYASDVYWYKIIDVTDCKSIDEYDYAPAIHASYFDKSGGQFSGVILSPGNMIRYLTSDRLYCVQVHAFLNYYNPAMRRDWGIAYSAVFRGGSAPYDYADCDVRIEPMPGGELSKNTPIVMTFTQPVDFVDRDSGIPQGQEGILSVTASSNADKTIWSFMLPEGAFSDSSIEVHLGFVDAATGKRVRPSAYNVPETEVNNHAVFNYGSEGNSQIVVTYGSFDGKPEFTVTPIPGSTIESMKDFTYRFSDNDDIMPSWMGEAVVRDESGEVVARLLADDLVENGGHVRVDYASSAADAKALAVHLQLDAEISKPGTYTIDYPYGYFSKGREMVSDFTRPARHIYIVKNNGQLGLESVEATDGIGVTVFNLQGIAVMQAEDPSALQSLPAGIYIIRSDNVSKKIVIK